MKAIWLALLAALSFCGTARAWGPEGHSIVAEIAQQRLKPPAAAVVQSLLGGRSLASVASWADDIRDERKDTKNWHFVDIPIDSSQYDPATQCEPTPEGDCAVAELDRLIKTELRCATGPDGKLEALKFAVHFVGDIHQPLHTVKEKTGGNTISVAVYLKGLVCSQACRTPLASNFHAAWDVDLIHAAVWDWGAYVDRLENGWLKTAPDGIDGGSPADWARETHGYAQTVWNQLTLNDVIDDDYFNKALPVLDRQLAVAGLRLARILNDAYASSDCAAQ
jgi:hypothetical protein